MAGWFINKDRNSWTSENKKYLMYMAMQDYCTERYAAAIEKYQRILKTEPENVEILKRMAYTYGAWGEKKKARAIWQKLLRMTPNDQEIRKELKSIQK
jgi:cytochrome c-type biogenesis protein CcmH/NrfG